MQHAYYGLALLIAISCMVAIDMRLRLALFANKTRASRTIIVGVGLFVVWDIAGILLDIFYTGSTQYILGLFIAPDFPIEELLFLTLLMYCTLLTYKFFERRI